MYGIYTISGERYKLACTATAIETAAWANSPNQAPRKSRLFGTLGEMAVAEHFIANHSQRTVVPLGMLHRLGLAGNNALDRGDILMIGKKKVAPPSGGAKILVDDVAVYEVKTTSNGAARGFVTKKAVEDYLRSGVVSIALVFVQTKEGEARCIIDEMAHPCEIERDWMPYRFDGVEGFMSRRIMKMRHANALPV